MRDAGEYQGRLEGSTEFWTWRTTLRRLADFVRPQSCCAILDCPNLEPAPVPAPQNEASISANAAPIGPCPPTPRVLPDLQAPEVRQPVVRRLPVRQLRPGPRRPRLPHRGAEDRQEGAQGADRQEEINVGLLSRMGDGGGNELCVNLFSKLFALAVERGERTHTKGSKNGNGLVL